MAGKFNKYLSKTLNTLESLAGRTGKKWDNRATVLREAREQGFNEMRAKRMAKVEHGRTFQNRVKAGLIVGGTGTAGFLGVHKYQQHQDNKILARIDKLYENQ